MGGAATPAPWGVRHRMEGVFRPVATEAPRREIRAEYGEAGAVAVIPYAKARAKHPNPRL
jgi:hypothetical protein